MRSFRQILPAVTCLVLATGTASADTPIDLEHTAPIEIPAVVYVAEGHHQLEPGIAIEPRVVSVTDDGVRREYVAALDNTKFPDRQAAGGGGDAGSAAEPAEPSADDLLARIAALQAEIARYRSATTSAEKRLAIFSILAAMTWVLLAGLKTLSGMSTTAKRWLPRAAAFAGVAVGLFTKLAIGEPWLVAVLYGAGPPLAVLIQELIKSWVKPKDPA